MIADRGLKVLSEALFNVATKYGSSESSAGRVARAVHSGGMAGSALRGAARFAGRNSAILDPAVVGAAGGAVFGSDDHSLAYRMAVGGTLGAVGGYGYLNRNKIIGQIRALPRDPRGYARTAGRYARNLARSATGTPATVSPAIAVAMSDYAYGSTVEAAAGAGSRMSGTARNDIFKRILTKSSSYSTRNTRGIPSGFRTLSDDIPGGSSARMMY